MDNLEKEELETLKAIINISYSLLDNLYNLTNLELNNNTDEIKKLCESIKQTLIVEKSLYEKFSSNRIEKVIQELNRDTNYDMKNEYNILNSGNKNELVKRRIMQKLNDRTNTLELLTSFFGKEVKYPVYLRNSLNKDIINTLLKLLNDSINTPKYNDILSYLYQFKYNILFLNDFALEDMLDNNFVINNSLYWESNLTLKLYDLNDYILDSFRMELSFNILSESVDGLGKMSRKKLKDKTNYAKSIIDQLLIRTSLLFLPEKEMLEVKKVIEKSIKTGELLNGEADAEKMILECFELYKQDIELPMVISLNLGV